MTTRDANGDPAVEPAPEISPVRLGLSDRERALFAPLAEDGFELGRVMRMDRGMAFVGIDGAVIRAEPAVYLLKAGSDTDSRIAVGDWVALARPEGHELAIVEVVLPRSSAFVRKDPGESTVGQVVAANVDIIMVIQALGKRGPNLRRLERELVIAWDSGARPVVVLNKADMCADPGPWRDEVGAVALGVDVHVVSGLTGEGVDELRAYTGGNRTLAFIGASGVGKSTLVNRLVGAEVRATGAIREVDGKGRHVTVSREMILMPGEGILIDTPGMRALALWEAEEGMRAAFPDIEELAIKCRFRDCVHDAEPGCAVRAAVENDELSIDRLENYRRLSRELVHLAGKQDVLARVNRKKGEVQLSKTIRRFNKGRGHK